MKQELLKDIAGILRFTPYITNRAAIASSGTITLKRPDGTTKQASTAASVNGTTGEITYSVGASLTDELGENYIAEWTYVVSGTTYYYTQLFDVVLHRLVITVIDSDLLNQQSDLLEKAEGFQGTVDSSTASTLVDDELKAYENDYFNNGKVEIVATATGVKQQRTVSDFVSSTGTLSVTPNWSTNPDTTYAYIVRRSFQKKIEMAFEEMMIDIRNKGFRPALILESTELHIPHIKKTLALICRDYIGEAEDKWHTLSQMYGKEYQSIMDSLQLQYDKDEGGNISGTSEKDRDVGSMRMVR